MYAPPGQEGGGTFRLREVRAEGSVRRGDASDFRSSEILNVLGRRIAGNEHEEGEKGERGEDILQFMLLAKD